MIAPRGALHLAGIMLAGMTATRAPLIARIAGGGLVLTGVALPAG